MTGCTSPDNLMAWVAAVAFCALIAAGVVGLIVTGWRLVKEG